MIIISGGQDKMIRAELRFKNASFINALEKAGYKSIAEFARQSGINYQLLIEYANLRYLFKKPEIIKKMVGLLETDEWTLFEQYREVIEKNNGVNTKMTTDIPTKKLISLTSEKLLQLKEPKDIEHDMIYNESLKIETDETLKDLTIRERNIIKMYYGIGIEHSLTLNEIAEDYNLTVGRIRQIKEKAIRRLKHYSRSDKLKQYLNGQ